MTEDEILMAIRALEWAVIDPQCTSVECSCGFTNLDQAVAYRAREALELELKRVRAGRPA
jgi:hypothetical protein